MNGTKSALVVLAAAGLLAGLAGCNGKAGESERRAAEAETELVSVKASLEKTIENRDELKDELAETKKALEAAKTDVSDLTKAGDELKAKADGYEVEVGDLTKQRDEAAAEAKRQGGAVAELKKLLERRVKEVGVLRTEVERQRGISAALAKRLRERSGTTAAPSTVPRVVPD